MFEPTVSARSAAQALWRLAGLPEVALERLRFTGAEPALPSSFAVGTAAQASIGAAALAAAEVRRIRGMGRQDVQVDMPHAVAECTNFMSVNGTTPEVWDKFSGIYPCGDRGSKGWVRIHANFAHHREGALSLLGLKLTDKTTKEDVVSALSDVDPFEYEQAAADKGLAVAALRSFESWGAHMHGQLLTSLPLFTIERIGEAEPLAWPRIGYKDRPLHGLRVLELTRILAGPVCGRTLAAYGADVMLVNSPNLPNIDAIAETSRGKLSCHIDLSRSEGRITLANLCEDAHVFVQGYRPGGLASLGFSPEALAYARPGIVYVSLSAYGHTGPWADRRGFDSLVQTATGFNHAEATAFGSDAPKALPVQILDHASGYLMALGAQAALIRQQLEGGSWHVRVSLAQTAHWLRSLGRLPVSTNETRPILKHLLESSESGFGSLVAVSHSAQFSATPSAWVRPSMPPGSHPPRWPT